MAFFNNSTTSSWTTLPLSSLTPERSASLVVRITIAVLSVSLNAALIAVYLIKPSYITNFTIYLMFLYIANTVYIAGARPLEFLSEVRGVNGTSFGQKACHFYNYVQRVLTVIPIMAHVLIAVNRLWALSSPITYRNRHTIKMAILICFGMVCYAHIFPLPAFVLNWHARSARAAGSVKCEGSTTVSMMQWGRAEICINRFLPLFIIIGSYGYIFVKQWRKKQSKVTANSNISGTRLSEVNTAAENPPVDKQTGQPISIITEKSIIGKKATVQKKVVRPFLVLTMTAVGVAVCWLPMDIINFCIRFLGIPVGHGLSEAFGMLYSVQFLFDPLMWPFSLRKATNTRQTVG